MMVFLYVIVLPPLSSNVLNHTRKIGVIKKVLSPDLFFLQLFPASDAEHQRLKRVPQQKADSCKVFDK